MNPKPPSEASLIVGRNPVREALEREGARIEKVMVQQGGGRGLDAIRRTASEVGVPVQYVPSNRLNQMAVGLNHQGVVAIAAPVAYHDVDEMLADVAPTLEAVRRHKPILLLLDRIEDPHNFGAVVRTAVAAGVEGVIVPKRHMAPLNAATIKASAGVATRIPVARVDDLAEVIFQLKERGYWVVGAAEDGETSVWDMDWDRPLVLVMGSEAKGLHRHVAEACDYLVSIPMRGDAESLNVSVAAGILLFAAARSREE